MSIIDFLRGVLSDSLQEEPVIVEKECFGGVSLDELNSIANECRFGGYVRVRDNTLYYYYKSARGHQTNCAEYIIREGKLQKMTYGGYPNQVCFPDEKFLKEANNRFSFR